MTHYPSSVSYLPYLTSQPFTLDDIVGTRVAMRYVAAVGGTRGSARRRKLVIIIIDLFSHTTIPYHYLSIMIGTDCRHQRSALQEVHRVRKIVLQLINDAVERYRNSCTKMLFYYSKLLRSPPPPHILFPSIDWAKAGYRNNKNGGYHMYVDKYDRHLT